MECGLAFRLPNLVGFKPRLAQELGYGKAVHHVMRAVAEYEDDLYRVWEVERPVELHLDGATVAGGADVILDQEGGVPTALAIVKEVKRASDNGGGERNRTAVEGFAGPCLNHSATPPGAVPDVLLYSVSRDAAVTSAQVADMPRLPDALSTHNAWPSPRRPRFTGRGRGATAATGAPTWAGSPSPPWPWLRSPSWWASRSSRSASDSAPAPPACSSPAWATCPSSWWRSSPCERADVGRPSGPGGFGARQRAARTGRGVPERGGQARGAEVRPEAPRMLVTLLALAVGAMLVPTLAARLDTPAVHHAAALSDVAAIVLLAVYVASIPFWLSGGPEGPATRPRAGAGPRPRLTAAGAGTRRSRLAPRAGHQPCWPRPAWRPAPSPTGSLPP